MVIVGVPTEPRRSRRSRSSGQQAPGGLGDRRHPETQEMLDFCGQHKIVSDIELIPIQKINEAYERTIKSDVRYRFVIDNASLTQG
jgi:uncharacterized zinc-type alcohol dehydrogenase-like protein